MQSGCSCAAGGVSYVDNVGCCRPHQILAGDRYGSLRGGAPVGMPQTGPHVADALLGSPVMPEIEITRAPASAAASAARCASSLTKYRATTSMESAAMAMMATMAIATSSRVTPCSWRREGQNVEIFGLQAVS